MIDPSAEDAAMDAVARERALAYYQETGVVGKGYNFKTTVEFEGVKIDMVIRTTKAMTAPILMDSYAVLSHGLYVELAKDIRKCKNRSMKTFRVPDTARGGGTGKEGRP